MLKKAGCLILTIIMSFGVLSTPVFAEEETAVPEEGTEEIQTQEETEEEGTEEILTQEETEEEKPEEILTLEETEEEVMESAEGKEAGEVTEEEQEEQDREELFEKSEKKTEKEEASNAGSTDGKAYAVLTGNGELIFFRSNSTYSNNKTGTFTDIKGNKYSGRVYAGIETLKVDDTDSPFPLAYMDSIPWYNQRSSIKKVFVATDQTIKPISTAFWFYELEASEINLNGFNTSSVTDMGFMFYGCSKLTSLDLSSLNTSNVTNMREISMTVPI